MGNRNITDAEFRLLTLRQGGNLTDINPVDILGDGHQALLTRAVNGDGNCDIDLETVEETLKQLEIDCLGSTPDCLNRDCSQCAFNFKDQLESMLFKRDNPDVGKSNIWPFDGSSEKYATAAIRKGIEEIYHASSFLNRRYGKTINTQLVIAFERAGVTSHKTAASMVTKFNHEAAKYFKRYGEEYCGFYVHENPPGGQHHVHLGIHLPKKMAPKFKVWVRGFWGRSLCTTITPTLLHIRVRHRKTIGYRLIRQWALFSYLGKGVAPDTGYKDIHGEFEPLSSIFKLRRHKPQGIISCRKRIGVTQNIGAAAREKAGFRSAFEMGEENRLFDTTELDLFEKEQNDIFVEQSPQINI